MCFKAFCRTCKGVRNQNIKHELKFRGEYDEYIQWIKSYRIIECCGCETISFQEEYGNSEMVRFVDEEGNEEYYTDINIYPLYLEEGEILQYQQYLPKNIKTIYEETINALKIKAYILAAGGLRAIIESTCNHLKIKKGALTERIDLLYNKNHLTLSESKRLHSIRFLGNDALHEIEIPKTKHLYILLNIINHLLANLFINDKILKGTVDTIIDSYPDFIKLIENKISKDNIGMKVTLKELLGKSLRLIPNKKLSVLEDSMLSKIKEGKINYLKHIESKPVNKYEVLKEPEFSFDW